MKFVFCGNVDCPEWVLAEVALLNRISAVKLKLILVQIVKKMTGQPHDNEKILKLSRETGFDMEETKVFLAILEFFLRQSTKHEVADKLLSKDLLQMGVAIENTNAVVKVFDDNRNTLLLTARNDSMRQSQI